MLAQCFPLKGPRPCRQCSRLCRAWATAYTALYTLRRDDGSRRAERLDEKQPERQQQSCSAARQPPGSWGEGGHAGRGFQGGRRRCDSSPVGDPQLRNVCVGVGELRQRLQAGAESAGESAGCPGAGPPQGFPIVQRAVKHLEETKETRGRSDGAEARLGWDVRFPRTPP